jgi:hypothetical protein
MDEGNFYNEFPLTTCGNDSDLIITTRKAFLVLNRDLPTWPPDWPDQAGIQIFMDEYFPDRFLLTTCRNDS